MSESLGNDLRQEANVALLEIDKGLRSSRPGEQCEAIVRLPSLMDRFPFPVLINVAFLKLADVFRTGSNLLRFNILKVVDITRKHHNKINSVEEFFRRIYSVIYSNDPIARSLALRFFASISTLIAEKKSVHHSIWKGLESHDQIEVEAAIIATDALCHHSSEFANGVCEKVTSIIQGLKTPPKMKLKVIPVLKRMNHDLTLASQVRNILLQLLSTHPSLSFVSVTLDTLTKLSISVLVQSFDQILLLIEYVEKDPRKMVREIALKGLHSLCVKTPQCWDNTSIEKLVEVIDKTEHIHEKVLGCKILYQLSDSIAVQHMLSVKELLVKFSFLSSITAAAYALSATCNILLMTSSVSDVYSERRDLMNQMIELLVIYNKSTDVSSQVIKMILYNLVKLSKNCPTREDMLEILVSQFAILPDNCYSATCDTVTAIVSSNEGHNKLYLSITHHLLQLINTQPNILLPVSVMLLELHRGSYSSPQYVSFVNDVQSVLYSHLCQQKDKSRYWCWYKIARQASKLGFHVFAEIIYKDLCKIMTDFKFKQWLIALQKFSHVQSLIISSLTDTSQLIHSLQSASSLLYSCSLIVKGSGQSNSLHTQFLPCIASLLDTYSQILSLCVTHSTLLSVYSNAVFDKFKEVTSQLHSVAGKFSNLSRSLFDCDPRSLNYIKLLQRSCVLLANIISSLLPTHKSLLSPSPLPPVTPISPHVPLASLETTESFSTEYTLGKVCNHVLTNAQAKSENLQTMPFSLEHLSMVETSTLALIQAPIVLPQSYFISFQSTKVQLVVSPTVPAAGQPVTISISKHLALKVEGVIEHSGKKIFRSPKFVFIQVVPKITKLFDTTFKAQKLQELEQTPPIVNDYFVGEFLLTFPSAGNYTVAIETSLVDDERKIWQTGPQIELNVLTDSDEKLKQIKQNPTIENTATSSIQPNKGSSSSRW